MLSLSPSRMILLGFARAPLTSIFPPVTASPARERVLKKRAAQSHLSIRVGSLVFFNLFVVHPVDVGSGFQYQGQLKLGT